MILTVGLGCQRGCEVEALLELFNSALAEAGIDPSQISALASITHKCDEPGIVALANALNLPLQCFDVQQLRPYEGRLSHRSAVVSPIQGATASPKVPLWHWQNSSPIPLPDC